LPSLLASSSGHCPLATRGRVDEGEITLLQEAKRSGSGSLQDAGTSPSEKKRRLADSLVARAERAQQLRTLVKNLNRGVKAVQQLAEHKNLEVARGISFIGGRRCTARTHSAGSSVLVHHHFLAKSP